MDKDDWTRLRVAWRDRALDAVVEVLERNPDTAELGRRIKHYLADTRRLEVMANDGRSAEAVERLREWTAERLPDIGHRRVESRLRPYKVIWVLFEGEFHAFRALNPGASVDDWHAAVQRAEVLLAHDLTNGKLPARSPLTPAQRDEVLFTEHGQLRTPRAMAWHLLRLACPPPGDAESFRVQFERLKLRPPAL